MARALYGADGFYRRPGAGPAEHFRTSAHNPVFAEAVGRLLLELDARLGAPDRLDFVDMAAGRGELAAGVVEWLAVAAPALTRRLRTVAVDLGPRPEGLPEAVEWAAEAPDGIVGLLIANEWLDNVVCDVAEVGPDGAVRIVEVDPETGAERLGPEPDRAQREWLARWWPLAGGDESTADPADVPGVPSVPSVPGVPGADGPRSLPGARAEIGLDRDAAWRSAVRRVERGVAVAVDYSHTVAGRPRFGTLTGYREGHQVPAVPDGSCDITAHVALDACAAALDPGIETVLTTQRDELHRLGVSGTRPDLAQASTDPIGYLRGLSRASAAAELTDPAGLGAFGWLLAFAGC
ncbi:SAM-dependent methyltransferase [Catenulispora yoronensis]|uniref:SAM-dependent methyltransferase n=2 Tax=Catenulispora yoronensis TaxID=450799 RepID=A0ABN2UE18_9ACTN